MRACRGDACDGECGSRRCAVRGRHPAGCPHPVGSAAFQLRHHIQDPRNVPESFAESLDSVTLAGLEGVLRAYENMLPTHPGIRSAALAARDKGTLTQFVAALPPMPRR